MHLWYLKPQHTLFTACLNDQFICSWVWGTQATDSLLLHYRCGDSTQPGIGVPAAAASGMITANTLAPIWSHLKMLDQLHM